MSGAAIPMIIFSIPIVALVSFFLYSTIDALAKASTEAAKHRSDNELKMVLAQRGMSAAEIERVVAAKPGGTVGEEPLDGQYVAAGGAVRAGGALPPNKHQPLHA